MNRFRKALTAATLVGIAACGGGGGTGDNCSTNPTGPGCNPPPAATASASISTIAAPQLHGDTAKLSAIATNNGVGRIEGIIGTANGVQIANSTNTSVTFNDIPNPGQVKYGALPVQAGATITGDQTPTYTVQGLNADITLDTTQVALGDSVRIRVPSQSRRESVVVKADATTVGQTTELGGALYYKPTAVGTVTIQATAKHNDATQVGPARQLIVTPKESDFDFLVRDLIGKNPLLSSRSIQVISEQGISRTHRSDLSGHIRGKYIEGVNTFVLPVSTNQGTEPLAIILPYAGKRMVIYPRFDRDTVRLSGNLTGILEQIEPQTRWNKQFFTEFLDHPIRGYAPMHGPTITQILFETGGQYDGLNFNPLTAPVRNAYIQTNAQAARDFAGTYTIPLISETTPAPRDNTQVLGQPAPGAPFANYFTTFSGNTTGTNKGFTFVSDPNLRIVVHEVYGPLLNAYQEGTCVVETTLNGNNCPGKPISYFPLAATAVDSGAIIIEREAAIPAKLRQLNDPNAKVMANGSLPFMSLRPKP